MLAVLTWNPTACQLRRFALAAAGMCSAGAVWLAAEYGPMACAWGLAAVAAGFAVVGVCRPEAARPLYVGLLVASYPLGWAAGLLVLAAVYFGLFTPLALVFRLIGRDALERRFDPAAASYWHPRPRSADPGRYLRQF
jgi:hypothetical protein